jgi:hypothetical protein
MRELEPKILDLIIKDKIKTNIPNHWQSFFRGCLREYGRFLDGQELKTELTKTIKHLDWRNRTRDAVIWGISRSILPIGLGSLLAITYLTGPPEPVEIELPRLGVEIMEPEPRQPVHFERERLILPKSAKGSREYDKDYDLMIKQNTRNKYVAYLMKCYIDSLKNLRIPINASRAQWKIFSHWLSANHASHHNLTPRHFTAIAKSIAYGLDNALTSEGKVDLEDACAISLLGMQTVNQARKAANSHDFKTYVDAKNSKGQYIISRTDKILLYNWLANIDTGDNK